MNGVTITPRVVVARGRLASSVPAGSIAAGSALVTEPDTSEKKLLWASDPYPEHGLIGVATRWRRLILAIRTSISGSITFEGSADGINYDFVATFAYTANTNRIINYGVQTPWVKVYFDDDGDAGPPDDWRFDLMGDESSADSGT